LIRLKVMCRPVNNRSTAHDLALSLRRVLTRSSPTRSGIGK